MHTYYTMALVEFSHILFHKLEKKALRVACVTNDPQVGKVTTITELFPSIFLPHPRCLSREAQHLVGYNLVHGGLFSL